MISILLTLILICINPFSATANIDVSFSFFTASDLGAPYLLHKNFINYASLNQENNSLFTNSEFKFSLPLNSTFTFNYLQRKNVFVDINNDTLAYLKALISDCSLNRDGDFHFFHQNLSLEGIGLSVDYLFQNFYLHWSPYFLFNNRLKSHYLWGTINNETAKGFYQVRHSETKTGPKPYSYGFSSDLFLQKKMGPLEMSLNLKNLGGFIIWKDLLFRSGEFQYPFAEYNKDETLIIIPPLKGIRFNNDFFQPLPLELNATINFNINQRTYQIQSYFMPTFRLEFQIPLKANSSLIAAYPFYFGYAWQSDQLQLHFFCNQLPPHTASTLGGALFFYLTF